MAFYNNIENNTNKRVEKNIIISKPSFYSLKMYQLYHWSQTQRKNSIIKFLTRQLIMTKWHVDVCMKQNERNPMKIFIILSYYTFSFPSSLPFMSSQGWLKGEKHRGWIRLPFYKNFSKCFITGIQRERERGRERRKRGREREGGRGGERGRERERESRGGREREGEREGGRERERQRGRGRGRERGHKTIWVVVK